MVWLVVESTAPVWVQRFVYTKWSVTCLRLCIRWESVWIRSESARKRAEDGSDQGHS